MVYSAGKQDHPIESEQRIEHVIELVEKKIAEIKAATPAPDVAAAALKTPQPVG
jgi:(E)-4-hydroxy-3-methylbut-2-enyl-diphosphate synthase